MSPSKKQQQYKDLNFEIPRNDTGDFTRDLTQAHNYIAASLRNNDPLTASRLDLLCRRVAYAVRVRARWVEGKVGMERADFSVMDDEEEDGGDEDTIKEPFTAAEQCERVFRRAVQRLDEVRDGLRMVDGLEFGTLDEVVREKVESVVMAANDGWEGKKVKESGQQDGGKKGGHGQNGDKG